MRAFIELPAKALQVLADLKKDLLSAMKSRLFPIRGERNQADADDAPREEPRRAGNVYCQTEGGRPFQSLQFRVTTPRPDHLAGRSLLNDAAGIGRLTRLLLPLRQQRVRTVQRKIANAGRGRAH